MVEESRNVYKAIKGYWNRRKGYEKLNGSWVEVIGGSENCRKRRFRWRIKLNRKLKLKFRFSVSLKKLLTGFRDGYVNFMNRIANTSRVTGIGFVSGGGGYRSDVVNGFGVRTLKEYDEKMIVDLYKSLVIAQAQLVPADVAKFGCQVQRNSNVCS